MLFVTKHAHCKKTLFLMFRLMVTHFYTCIIFNIRLITKINNNCLLIILVIK